MSNRFIVVLTVALVACCFIFATRSKNDAVNNGAIGDVKYSLLALNDFIAQNGEGWVLMKGQAIDPTWEIYKDVFKRYSPTDPNNPYTEMISPKRNNLPDASGVFLRGMNVGRGTDSGNADSDKKVGTYQLDAFQGHKFPLNKMMTYKDKESGFNWDHSGAYNEYRDIEVANPIDDGHGVPRVASETRPRNVVVYIYVKVKN